MRDDSRRKVFSCLEEKKGRGICENGGMEGGMEKFGEEILLVQGQTGARRTDFRMAVGSPSPMGEDIGIRELDHVINYPSIDRALPLQPPLENYNTKGDKSHRIR